MELGNQIKEHRANLKLTQDELAEKVFVTRQTISNWENDKSYPDIHSLLLLSNIFDVTLDQLVKGDIEIMNEKINEPVNKEVIRRFQRDSNIFSVLLMLVIISAIPITTILGIWGVAIWVIMTGLMIYFSYRVEKVKRENDIYTYREIVAFTNGKKLDEIEKAREAKKRKYQKVIFAILAALCAMIVCILMVVVMGIK